MFPYITRLVNSVVWQSIRYHHDL